MPVEVIMPKVDMDMANGIIAHWHAIEGDTVIEGEPLFDIETDKSNMEVEAPASGVLKQVVAANGDTVNIGVCIAQIYAQDEALVPLDEAADTRTSTLLANEVDEHHAGTGVGNPMSSASNSSSNNLSTSLNDVSAVADVVNLSGAIADQSDKIRATPLARKIAKQRSIALHSVTGSGPRGRITKRDVENAAEHVRTIEASSPTTQSTLASTTQLDALGIAYTRIPAGRMRTTIARRLTDSKSSVPHFYLECDCRVDTLQAYRKDLNEGLGIQALGIQELADNVSLKISLNDLIVMAAAKALEAVPEANVLWAGAEVIQLHDANISVAVSIDNGLMTPVVRAAQSKSIKTITVELGDLSARARLGKLSPSEYQGGSMSVTNLGMYGVQRFQAIINPPEAMILAVGAASKQIVVDEHDQPLVTQVMSVCLSCDHRVVDGVVAARWLKAFQSRIENPIQLML